MYKRLEDVNIYPQSAMAKFTFTTLCALACIFVLTLTSVNAQANAADVQECDSLTTASSAASLLRNLGIPVPSDPNELVGTRCTQDTGTLCSAIPPTARW
ncbi:hypothetical protein BV25DRAFT_756482 [Artomyces pyxidatus]|uniref:Uncharacterized protein n=1 Tax=Artomyces pyxidatus TaxID=48021 RepID=A0ACB8SZ12_9AGAM|nr:hypothetical protein BV25DRAFT_756482 [Artomyces pyxidatus]